jgi:hypothetical protein
MILFALGLLAGVVLMVLTDRLLDIDSVIDELDRQDARTAMARWP